ncbi:uncharacterized protein SCODWIG_03405 [Saccharomycodes ludwigii]|uniref:Nucleotide exchange factor SIL1 n=1 Tax=Saccharomycodes ludwigii TaxID=36035 RepID=A0A376BAR1_9ASCO|nr:uncharacterized protein SCODWIG_03405 [Saccharomycodes ludwigii]
MDTGRKEAKIIEKNIPDPKMVDISHEFVDDFRDLNEAMKQNEENKIIQILDKLDEYAHDYKHGSKIIKYEQDVLSELMLSKVYGDKVKEISARVLSGCLRNNPPAIQIYNPRYVDELVNSLIFEKNPIVLKRYLGVLQTVADKASNSSNLFTNLLKVYKGDIDNQIKLRVLEILSDLELSDARGKGLVKRSVNGKDDKNEPTLQQWFNEFSTNIQNSQLDEYHLKRFFHTLVNIKKEGGSNVKVSKDFLNWLSKQTEERKEALNDDLAKRDLEQYEFNKKLIESRHLLFGNPLADRIKNFNDEF